MRVMQDVYSELNPDIEMPKRSSIRSPFYFNSVFFNDGIFHLNTFGNCACLGKNPDPFFITYRDRYTALDNINMPIEYWLHNADSASQRLSLYAGAGSLAWFATQGRIS